MGALAEFESNLIREQTRISQIYRNESAEVQNTEAGLSRAINGLRTACTTHQRQLKHSQEIADRTFDRLNEDVAKLRSEQGREEDIISELEADASAVRTEEMQQQAQTSNEVDLLRATSSF